VLLQKEVEIDVKTLPNSIVQAILKVHPKAVIEEAEKIIKSDGVAAVYEVEIKVAGKQIELEIDVSGNILKTKDK